MPPQSICTHNKYPPWIWFYPSGKATSAEDVRVHILLWSVVSSDADETSSIILCCLGYATTSIITLVMNAHEQYVV